jgi:hypothetical protein
VLVIGVVLVVNNHMPQLEIPTPIMPNPNARDLFIQAANAAQNGTALGTGNAPLPLGQQQQMLLSDAPALATMHQALNCPYMELPARRFTVMFPHYAQLRSLARSVAFDSSVEAASGRWDAASELALDDVQMGEMIPHGGVIIGELVGVACGAIGRSQVWPTVDHVSATEARRALTRLQQCDALHVPYKDTLTEEKWFGLAGMADTLRRTSGTVTMASANGTNRLAGVGMMLYVLALGKGRVMGNLRNTYDHVIAEASKPYAPNFSNRLQPNGDMFSQMLLPVLGPGRMKELDDLAQIRLLELAFAMRAYRLEHHELPNSLNDLVTAGYLKSIPADPFRASGPLMYRKDGAKPVIYSIGPDGIDNGGTAIYDASRVQGSYSKRASYAVVEDSKGDIVAGTNQ